MQNHSDALLTSLTAAPATDKHCCKPLVILRLCFALGLALALRLSGGLLDGVTNGLGMELEVGDALLESLARLESSGIIVHTYISSRYTFGIHWLLLKIYCACLHICLHLDLIHLISQRRCHVVLRAGQHQVVRREVLHECVAEVLRPGHTGLKG